MARLRVILEDDTGSPISEPRVYDLGQQLHRLRDIEAAVEAVKQSALPDLEAELLTQAQARDLAAKKKGNP
jgi:hypothetical protein